MAKRKERPVIWLDPVSKVAVIDGYGPFLADQMRAGEIVDVCGVRIGVRGAAPEPLQLTMPDEADRQQG